MNVQKNPETSMSGVTKQAQVMAVSKRMGEMVFLLDDNDCDDFLSVARRLHAKAKAKREGLESASTTTLSLDDLLKVDEQEPKKRERSPEVKLMRKHVKKKAPKEDGEGEWIIWNKKLHRHIVKVLSVDPGGQTITVTAQKSHYNRAKPHDVHMSSEDVSKIDDKFAKLFIEFFKNTAALPEKFVALLPELEKKATNEPAEPTDSEGGKI